MGCSFDLVINQALSDLHAKENWPYLGLIRGSCWAHVLIKNVLVHISKIPGKENNRLRLMMFTDIKVVHQCSSKEQFDAVSVLFKKKYCDHNIIPARTAAIFIYKA
jgi:hypothetical protein